MSLDTAYQHYSAYHVIAVKKSIPYIYFLFDSAYLVEVCQLYAQGKT